jgi:hypothetical protein
VKRVINWVGFCMKMCQSLFQLNCVNMKSVVTNCKENNSV